MKSFFYRLPSHRDWSFFYTKVIIKKNITPTKMPLAGFEPQTLEKQAVMETTIPCHSRKITIFKKFYVHMKKLWRAFFPPEHTLVNFLTTVGQRLGHPWTKWFDKKNYPAVVVERSRALLIRPSLLKVGGSNPGHPETFIYIFVSKCRDKNELIRSAN